MAIVWVGIWTWKMPGDGCDASVSRRPPFLADDVMPHHPCHIFGVPFGSGAACCSPVCCPDQMHPAPSCVCPAAPSRLPLGPPPLLHKGSRVLVFKRGVGFLVECTAGMGVVNEIQWLCSSFYVFFHSGWGCQGVGGGGAQGRSWYPG